MQKLITVNAATFAVNINNVEHSESPYIAMLNDAIARAEEEL